MAWSMSEAPTMVTRLEAGPVEYRLEQRGDMSVVVFHGGHVRAGLPLGEEVFAEAGYTLLVPSRPGYGRTPLSTGTSVSGFCDVTRALCAQLGITRIAAVVGTSGGGPTAVTMAARHPDLVQRLILQSAVGWLSYPARRARLGAHVIFTARTEWFTWAAIGALMRRAPNTGLRMMLSGLSTLPVRDVMAALSPEDRAVVIDLFCRMRSGQGFLNDLRPTPDATGDVDQPTLVIATRNDGGVPFADAESLAAAIRHATLVQSQADTHLIWLGQDWPTIADRIRDFLTTEPPHPPSTVPHA
jgi:pimeloyl-ACP methyl ester carboxylesterase